MVFLLLSVNYPTKSQRDSFFAAVGANFMMRTSALYKPLPASANDEEWKEVLATIRKLCRDEIVENEDRLRPLKPDDDNYSKFVGSQWEPNTSGSSGRSLDPQLEAFLLNMQGEPIPHYNHCATCTKPSAKQKCSRCKIVKYCDRVCQTQHWK